MTATASGAPNFKSIAPNQQTDSHRGQAPSRSGDSGRSILPKAGGVAGAGVAGAVVGVSADDRVAGGDVNSAEAEDGAPAAPTGRGFGKLLPMSSFSS